MNQKTVLIAEDSSVIQNLTRKILEFQNFHINTVKNGKEVLTYLETNSPDLILMDITMPILDGMDCAKAIRALKDPIKSKIQIVAITGNAKNYSSYEFEIAGISHYLTKPLDFDALVSLVKKLLDV